MHQLEFRANYGVTLYSFVDKLSHWNSFIGDQTATYFQKEYGILDTDRRMLAEYRQLRTHLSWNSCGSLYRWAYGNFQEEIDRFSGLLNALRYFETRERHDGITLKSELEDVTRKLQEVKSSVTYLFAGFQAESLIFCAIELFNTIPKKSVMPCYLTFSPDKNSTNGGAGKNYISAEVSIVLEKQKQAKIAAETVLHEYMHVEIQPGRYFRKAGVDGVKGVHYSGKIEDFLEEVIIYSLCEVLVLGEDPRKNREYYESIGNEEMVEVWDSVKVVSPILGEYLRKALSKSDTIKQIIEVLSS